MIHAVILAGGWGRRFWPKSRKRLPKQLLCIGKKCSPTQDLFNIIKTQIPKERIWVVTNKIYAHSLRKQLPALPGKNFLVEPLAKNTAAAVGLASVIIKKSDPEAVTWVLSSDQMLGQKSRFLKAMKEASMKAEEADVLVTIGIRPNRAAQEFGYLKITQNAKRKMQNEKAYKVEKFIEKPTLPKAKMYVKSKRYLWNSGIFVWRVSSILKAIKKYLPQAYCGLQRIEKAKGLPQYKSRLLKEYGRFRNVSIDYGVMEKAQNIYAVVGDFFLQDLGSWSNLSQDLFVRDSQGNIIQGLHKGINTSDSIIFSENKHLIATLGVRDLIVVHTPGATLVCRKENAQEIKKLTEVLEKDKRLRKYL
ncbi:MAG: mannose-1-phosphate guanylyltransferase [Candidatus Omnitrophica bacterium]|nr:mannose-1-phosphate guanylyltransferase [Candidatus Omnitrophota bacterium]MBU4140485.1 mannose-1-phosphate guanylyltransferase [Candidatus Omnitrophota bacterium]